jgi:putative DNA primase/helicase
MDAAALAHALGATRSGRQWKCKCVAHEDREPSMIIFDGRERVQVRCLAGCDQQDLINALRSRGLWERGVFADAASYKRTQAAKVSCETEALRSRDRARRIFDDADLCHGTLAQRYLESREIWSVAREIEDARFHPKCPREKGVQPAIVVAMRMRGAPGVQAVQRIFLTSDARKDGAMMLGIAGGAAMMLGGVVSNVLNVAEGFESGVSVRMMDSGATWALGSAGALDRLGVLDDVDRLVIWADHDAAGMKAALACRVRWREAGRDVAVWVPPDEGQDAADVWRSRCARQ